MMIANGISYNLSAGLNHTTGSFIPDQTAETGIIGNFSVNLKMIDSLVAIPRWAINGLQHLQQFLQRSL
jgi:hypothetical protein